MAITPPDGSEEQDGTDFLATQLVFGSGGPPTVGLDVEVTADDPDGDPLLFSWTIDGVGLDSEEQPGASSTTSICTLYGAYLDGSTLALLISDRVDAIGLSWPLVYVGD